MIRTPIVGQQVGMERFLLLMIIGIAIALVAITALQPWVDPRWLYLDTQTVGELSGDCCHIYDGAMSTMGIMLWASTAAVSLFASLFSFASNKSRSAMFGLHACLLSMLLALDDAYLFHEVAGPELGIPQSVMIGGIAVAMVTYLLAQRHFLLGAYSWLLILSLACFGLSLGIDQVVQSIESLWVVAEDGPKFIGILAWFLFHLMTQLKLALTPNLSHS